ncbi:hypothetical protein H6F88_27215 [Oculatella sp. FACHB-28]|uniref:hypothetical protein n=1 Tax=Cyanophyceae TaxID=3028117 RepID=UPI00168577CE|nr:MULTISPECIES: hypothetical protein [Cyanophyceae]MBD2059636.1 hypothetical protein [Oculatella sp. FACHB-28]MBD2068674.1 hypothetical protein [Leptolyngbya sp. FACHB-671]
MKRELAINFLFSFVGGAMVWALSPSLSGQVEPWDWDATGFYYSAALLIVGLTVGFARPKHVWSHYAGIILGQLTYMLLFLPGGPLIPVGVAFLAAYSTIALAGAASGAWFRRVSRGAW